jgi:hypothetical protein
VGGDSSAAGDPAARPASEPSRPGRYRGVHRARARVGRRAAVAAVLVLGVVAAVLLLRPWSGSDSARGAELAGVAPDVVRWLEAEVPPGTPVTASGDVRTALDRAGAGDRVGARTDGALRVVEGGPPDGSLVLARFGAADGAALSVVDPAPVPPTPAELQRRRSLAAAVLENPVAGATGRAAEALRTGAIDARLLGLLAGLVSRMDVHVADLPPAPGEPPDGPPARRLLVDEAAGERLIPGAAATEDLVAYLAAQRPPFAPDSVESTDDGVLVAFDYESAPDAAVTAATP